jgi:23S rRNA pseudouridine2457 synthase
MHRYFMLNKPLNMVSQFVSSHQVRLLGDLDFQFPEGTHAIGRLDNHSEGLLLLTTDKRVTRLLFQSGAPHQRAYLVKVKHEVGPETLEKLRSGIGIRVKGGDQYTTAPATVEKLDNPAIVYPALADSHYYGPYSWLLITLTEGRFHQVRKMVREARHRCLRLIRISIEDMQLGDLPPGAVQEFDQETFFRLLRLEQTEEQAP